MRPEAVVCQAYSPPKQVEVLGRVFAAGWGCGGAQENPWVDQMSESNLLTWQPQSNGSGVRIQDLGLRV